MLNINVCNSYPEIKTDETIREKVSHGTEQYPFQYYLEDIWQFNFHCIDWHWHPELEFVYIEKGTATIFVGNNKYTLAPGNGIFINTQVIHRFESTESTVIPNIVFSPLLLAARESLLYQKYIRPILISTECQIFSSDIPWQKEVIDTLKSIFSIQTAIDSCELQTVQFLYKIWHIMFDNMNFAISDQASITDMKDQARLQIMIQYIHENYQDDLSLENLAQLVSLSKSSILNLFNEYVHTSPIDYVLHYRLKKAAQLLDTTDNTILNISKNTGFNNVGYFCRKFKYYFKVTPSQYRNSDH